MKPDELLTKARDVLTVRQVVGEPHERDGVTVIPVAHIRGGGGGGDDGIAGEGRAGPAGGGGFGLDARPVGAYVLRDGDVRFEPAVDLTRIIVGGQLLVGFALLVLRSILRRRSSR
jgi:uncharacterized spore protein YtfJ